MEGEEREGEMEGEEREGDMEGDRERERVCVISSCYK